MITASELGRLAARVKMAADPTFRRPDTVMPSVAGSSAPKPSVAPYAPDPKSGPGGGKENWDYVPQPPKLEIKPQVSRPEPAKISLADEANQLKPLPALESSFQDPTARSMLTARPGLEPVQNMAPFLAYSGGHALLSQPTEAAIAAQMQPSTLGRIGSGALTGGRIIKDIATFPFKAPVSNAIFDYTQEAMFNRPNEQRFAAKHRDTLPALNALVSPITSQFSPANDAADPLTWAYSLYSLATSPITHLRNLTAKTPGTPARQRFNYFGGIYPPKAPVDMEALKRQQTAAAQAQSQIPYGYLNGEPEFLASGLKNYRAPDITRSYMDWLQGKNTTVTDRNDPTTAFRMAQRQATQEMLLNPDTTKATEFAKNIMRGKDGGKHILGETLHPDQSDRLYRLAVDSQFKNSPDYRDLLSRNAAETQVQQERFNADPLSFLQHIVSGPKTLTDAANEAKIKREPEDLLRIAFARGEAPSQQPKTDITAPENMQALREAMVASGVVKKENKEVYDYLGNPSLIPAAIHELVVSGDINTLGPDSPLIKELIKMKRPDLVNAFIELALRFAP